MKSQSLQSESGTKPNDLLEAALINNSDHMRFEMQSKSIRVFALALIMLIPSADLFAQKKAKHPPAQLTPAETASTSKIRLTPPSGANFYLAAIPDAVNQYSMLLTDADNRTLAGTFTRQQISLFRALLVAAKEFGETSESAGTTAKPITTRFKDKNEPSFIVDVEKTATHTRFYVSMSYLGGKITTAAGTIKRGSKDPEKLLMLTILSRIEAITGENQAPR
jgi:hypothetical protein